MTARSSLSPQSISREFTYTGALAVKVGQARWTNHLGRTLRVVGVYADIATAPTGSSVLIDVNKNGTSFLTAQLAIAASANSGTGSFNSGTQIANGDYLTVDVDQIGSTVAGSDLVVSVVLA